MVTYDQLVQQVIDLAMSKLGDAYNETPGQNIGPTEFDCQGFCYYVYGNAAGLWSGPGIGAIGSAAQYWNSTVKVPTGKALRPGQQAFFWGASAPRPGHTGIVTEDLGGDNYNMISALDTASGVCYSQFVVTSGGTDGLSYYGATDPLLLLNPTPPPTPAKDDTMILIYASGPAFGSIPANSAWEYFMDGTGNPTLRHVSYPSRHNVLKLIYGSEATISPAELNELNCKIIYPTGDPAAPKTD